MKTLLLLASVTFAATAVTAQQHAASSVFTENTARKSISHEPEQLSVTPAFKHGRNIAGSSARTTSNPTSRWYNYGDYLGAASTVHFAANYLWNDTTSVDAYAKSVGTGTDYLFNDIVSVGLVCDPFYLGWSDEALYAGMMKLTPADAYVIDSVFISGVYYRNNDKTTPVDTLTVAVVYGDGSAATDLHYKAIDTSGGRSWIHAEYGVDSLFYMNMHHDSVNNHADTFAGGFTPVVRKIFLTSADTSSVYQAVIPLSINVPAGGNMPAVSLSFKSGDPTFTFGDTVYMSDGITAKYKYGMFRPILAYEGSAATPSFPVVSKYNMNQGEFRDAGSDRLANGLYRPMWFWYNAGTGGASTYQYPYCAFHISCPTCGAVGVNTITKDVAVNAYPNPANNEVTVTYSLASTAKVSVTLTNILGQQVAVKNVDDAQDGKVVFNTTMLPDGLYMYTFVASGERITGRFVVAH